MFCNTFAWEIRIMLECSIIIQTINKTGKYFRVRGNKMFKGRKLCLSLFASPYIGCGFITPKCQGIFSLSLLQIGCLKLFLHIWFLKID